MDKECVLIDRLGSPLTKRDRLVTFFKKQVYVDCTFKIDGIEIKAHKLILASSSPVFEKMFYGDMAQDVIEICDISVDEFNQMLDYVYTERLDIYSVLNAWNLFYIANKYLLEDLICVCLEFIRNNLTMNSVVLSYEYADMYELFDIRKKCFEDMVNYVNGVFYCDYHVKSSTLRRILDRISSPSFDLLIRVIQWGVVECELRHKQILSNNVVNILKEENIVNYFNKDCYDIKNFPQKNDDLVKQTLELLYDVLEWSEQPYDLSKTSNFAPKFCRFRKEFKIACRVDLLPNEEFSSGFIVNRSMFLFGISIATPMEPPNVPKKPFYEGVITVRICLCDNNIQIVEPMRFNVSIPYSSMNYYLNFYNLAVLEPKNLYYFKISFSSPNVKGSTPLHCYYMSNKLLCENKEASVTFFEVNGTFIKGVSFYPA
ncbi:BTB/POZ domain-containing protein 6 [Diorhabda sublineata]|uniref:BTB/POZ domain-containing protein 6 n=1 Tax=Diorhabda sublineata TaxID=1163346 RepID=UPI0024E13AE1|nr:BTB/POZ domain-containing protein 6 [Diorhabda sublineata]